MNIEVPKCFYISNQELLEELKKFINKCESIINEDMYFFPEYTAHDTIHINNILKTIEQLIPEETKLEDENKFLLIISIILHDLAMHIDFNQFKSLISENKWTKGIKELDKVEFNKEWDEFVYKFNRQSNNELFDLLGSYKKPNLNKIREIESLPENEKLEYQKAIGAFLRIHHHKIAHFFARKNTLPNYSNSLLDTNEVFLEMAGLISRGHGVNIRSLDEYITKNHRDDRINIIYIMMLLRVSDYLDLGEGRTLKLYHKKNTALSPSSKYILNKELYIESLGEISNEKLDINIKFDSNNNLEIYLDIKRFLENIQKEIDRNWAILGEIDGKSKKYGFTLRRIDSNIYDKDRFIKETGFFPEYYAYSLNNVNVMSLFLNPLYGDKPEYAMRELIQNSIDAIHEKNKLIKQNDIQAKVEIDILRPDGPGWCIKVLDNGIGMKLSTIIDYFLKIGSSFRNSEEWKNSFTDSDGRSEIIRTGQFGVGTLATYMLDTKNPKNVYIEVFTKHIDSDYIYSFKTYFSEKPIKINRIHVSEYKGKDISDSGTIIYIYTENPPSFITNQDEGKKWDFYCFDYPRVVRKSLTNIEIEPKLKFPINEPPINCYEIVDKNYEKIIWTYNEDLPKVIGNGLEIIDNNSRLDFFRDKPFFINNNRYKVEIPKLILVYKDSIFPISLSRDSIEYDKLPFLENLFQEIKFNILAFYIAEAPVDNYQAKTTWRYSNIILSAGEDTKVDWVFSNTGVFPLNINLCKSFNITNIFFVKEENIDIFNNMKLKDNIGLVFVKNNDDLLNYKNQNKNYLIETNIVKSKKETYINEKLIEKIDKLYNRIKERKKIYSLFNKVDYSDKQVNINKAIDKDFIKKLNENLSKKLRFIITYKSYKSEDEELIESIEEDIINNKYDKKVKISYGKRGLSKDIFIEKEFVEVKPLIVEYLISEKYKDEDLICSLRLLWSSYLKQPLPLEKNKRKSFLENLITEKLALHLKQWSCS